jgi:hypothetical protein
MLSPGTHKISIFVDDGNTHNISKMITITSYEIDSDNDGSPDHIDDDDDNDDIPDWWEEQYGLDPKSSEDAEVDIDKDGYSNYDEFRLNSSPLDSNDPSSDEGLGDEEDDKSETIGFEWILIMVVIIIILIVILVIVLILIKRNRDPKQDKPELPEPKDQDDKKPEMPSSTPPADIPQDTKPSPAPPAIVPPASEPAPEDPEQAKSTDSNIPETQPQSTDSEPTKSNDS